ncbi:MAG TPA: type II toxin-antitoxin system VapB family antitoxin [Granulicella sp.]|jgi:hypothetical protein
MTVLIEDEQTIAEIERIAAATGKSVPEIVADAVSARARQFPKSGKSHSYEEYHAAIREAQDWFATHRDPSDHRTPDEIIGYNEHGHFS